MSSRVRRHPGEGRGGAATGRASGACRVGFATSLSIVISSVVSLFIPSFNFSLRPTFLAGSTLVIAATILYSTIPASPKGAAKAPTPLHELSASEYERQL